MNNSLEREYLQLLKRRIEATLALDRSNGSVKSSDLEYVAEIVKEKSGISLSLSTLKRIWRGSFAQLPQPTTLNALAAVLDYDSWQAFKQANPIEPEAKTRKKWPVLAGIFFIAAVVFVLIQVSKTGESLEAAAPEINGPVHLTTKRTVTSGLPNTVVFNYDLSNVKADSFFFQQSWNAYSKRPIDPKGNAVTVIYYESGYHRGRLIANNRMVAMQPVHILSDGWESHVYYGDRDLVPIDFKAQNIIHNGQLHIDTSLLEKQHVDLTRNFYTRFLNSREFKVSSDNFRLVTRIKVDSLQYSECPWMNVIVVNEKNIFTVHLLKKGCEHYGYYKLGEIARNGSDNDLSTLGRNVYQWQEVGITVKNKDAVISINGKDLFEEKYNEDFGNIVELIFMFERTGSVDFVNLSDTAGRVVYEDGFEQPG